MFKPLEADTFWGYLIIGTFQQLKLGNTGLEMFYLELVFQWTGV